MVAASTSADVTVAALSLPATSLIDSEAVACGDDGLPAFDLLRYRWRDVFLYAFLLKVTI